MAQAFAALVSASSSARGALFAFFAFAGFATVDAVVKQLSATFSIYQVGFLVCAVSSVLVLGQAAWDGSLRHLMPRRPGLVVLRAALASATGVCAWNAFSRLPLADAYGLIFTMPLLVTALSVPLLGERVGWRRWTAVLVGFAGVLVMVGPGSATLQIGHLFALGAATLAALALIVLRWIGPGERAGTQLMAVMIGSLAVTAPGAISEWQPPDLHLWRSVAIAGVLVAAAQLSMIHAMRNAPAVLVAPFQYTQLIWALLYGALLFGDMPNAQTLLGAAIVATSGLYVVRRERVRKVGPIAVPARQDHGNIPRVAQR
ncbi:MAG: DMT family transporter [Geminicoccaceae bacterium]